MASGEGIAAYRRNLALRYNKRSESGAAAQNDVPNTEHNQTTTCPTADGDQSNRWPSHARICRTLPENDANRRTKYGRGVLKGIKVAKKRFDKSSEKLPIEFSSRLGGTIGTNYRSFVDDVVMFMKKYVPLVGVKKWSDVDGNARSSIVADMIERWDLPDTPATSKKILNIARERYRGWRSTLHATYKAYTTDDERRRNRPEDVDPDEWEGLMEYFGTDERFQELSRKNSENRKKQKTKHVVGSKSYSQISYEKRNLVTGEEPDDIELWELTHVKNGEWSNTESQAVFDTACARVSEKENEGHPVSNEERNLIFQSSYRTSVGCKSSRFLRGRGYMAKPPSNAEILAELTEQARETSEARRQNEELNQHVQDLEVRNEELSLTVEKLHNQLVALEKEREEDRVQREKQLEAFQQSLRDEVLSIIEAQSAAMQQFTQQRSAPRNLNGSKVVRSLCPNQISSLAGSGQRVISSHQLLQSARNCNRSRVDKFVSYGRPAFAFCDRSGAAVSEEEVWS